ncbi:MAG: 6-carboxytetrahydropterin synthase [Phycisphaeraceae bacterium]
MYEITIHRVFAAAHAIRLYDGSIEPLHGHNWTVEVTAQAKELDAIEVVIDFHELERIVDALLAKVNNRNLNETPPFSPYATGSNAGINPSAERVAWWIGTETAKQLPGHARLVSVKVGEAPGCVATWRP